jgi:hypothetical protein
MQSAAAPMLLTSPEIPSARKERGPQEDKRGWRLVALMGRYSDAVILRFPQQIPQFL